MKNLFQIALLIVVSTGVFGQDSLVPTSGIFTDPRDGHAYKWVKIGSQTWMAENMAWLPTISTGSKGSKNRKHCYIIDLPNRIVRTLKASKVFKEYQDYGVLYNWPAAVNGHRGSMKSPGGIKGACPDGWHLPSGMDFYC